MQKMNPMVQTAVVAVAAGVIGAGAGFYAARLPQFSSLGGTSQMMANGQFGQGGRGQRAGGQGSGAGAAGAQARFMNRGVMGEVTSLDDKSITVKMPDGSSKIVIISDTTKYENTASAKKEDVKSGTTVRVIGTPNADGSVTADSVMLNPQTFGPMGVGQGTPQPAQK
jgi:hypothetical protein